MSDLQRLRLNYQPSLPAVLQGTSVRLEYGDATRASDPSEADTISQLLPNTYAQPLVRFVVDNTSSSNHSPPLRVGVVFCGRQSPGGHNVIWGIYDALKAHNPDSCLLGFLDGSEGLFAQRTLEITDDIISNYRNQGGYDMLGRTKDQIRTDEQIDATLAACTSLKLDGLVIIGGVTSNTDAAQLAEKFAEEKCSTKVVGVPVTLNGDLKNQFVETNVGFDTICKVNSQLISNVCTDALSAQKYYYFIRLMGQKASHVALECTLQSHPNMVILGEEVSASKLTLSDLTKQICNTVQARAEQDKYHGVFLLPEGLIESIPEVYALLQEIHGLLRQVVSVDDISSQLSPTASSLFELLPSFIREQFLLSPESDDSAQLSQIETEKLLAQLVEEEMNKRSNEGTYKGKKFNAICHFFGYQARGSVPSKFDCDYAFVLGHVCYHILAAGLTGYLATVTNLKNSVDKWLCGAAPITAMMTVKRFGYGPGVSSLGKPALHPATVDLKGKAYELLRQNATKFLMDDVYRNTGPLQFDGPGADSKAVTLCIENQDYMDGMEEELVVGQVESKTSLPPLVLEAEQVESETAPPPSVLEVDQAESETTPLLGLEVENQKITSVAPPPATSVSVVSQSHQQEKAIDLEPFVMVEFREEDNVPDANVLVDSKNNCLTSIPKEEKVLVTNNPSNGQIQDATILKGSSELENMPDGSMKAETEVDNQKIAMVVVPPATSESGDVLQYHEQEEVTKDPSQVDKVAEANVLADSKNSCPTSKPKEEKAPVTNNPSDGQVQDATVLKAETEADKQKTVPAPPPATSNSGDAPESHEQEDALSSEPERETSPVTKYPNGCQIQDATVQKDSSEMNNGLCLSDDSIRAETEVDNYQSTTVAPSPATSEYVLQPHEQEGVASSKLELEKTTVTIDPSEDAIVLKESLEMDNNLHSPDESMRVETDVANQKSTMVAPSAATFNSGDVPLSHGQKEATSSESVPVLESKDDDNVPSADVLVDRVDCGPISIPDEVDASVTEDPSDGQIKEATVQKELSKKDDGLHSPDDCVKPDTVGDDLLRFVKNTGEVEVEVTNTSNKVNEISKSENVTDSSCTDDNREECNHPSEAGVEIPVVSCHVNGSLVHDAGRNGVSDLISDSEILSHSSTNGINISPTDGVAISQSQVQFGSFVPAIYHVNGSCADDSGRITSQDANGFEHVRRGDFSKPVVEKTVAVECIERPFNFLIKVPKHFDIELDDDQFRQTELLVEEKTAKRDAIKSKMQMIRRNVQQARSALTYIASEERAARRSVKLKRQEIDLVHAVINRVKNALSVDDIDMRIKHIEHMMQHETMPLKDEKQYIHDIKQLKLYRETLSSNMGSQDEVREALDQKDQIEDRLKVLKMDLDRLKKIHSTVEAATVAADKKLKAEKKKLEEMYAEYVEAQNLRQEAYVNLQLLKRRFYEKNAHFRKYKDDLAAAESSRDKGALHHLCLNQVEKMMELWNNDDKFRKEYVRCNTRSTIWRLGTMDGRALGPGEESPVVVDGRNKSFRSKVGQVNPELALVSPNLEKKDEQPLSTKAVEIAKVVAVEKIVEKSNKAVEKTNNAVEKTNNAVKTKKATSEVSLVNSSLPINSLVESIATSEEESAIKQTKEEQEVAMGEEQLRKAEEEAKLKEQRRLEEIAKAKEALERKRKIAEKAQLRAEMRAQKEAEQKDKEKEKRAKKKERKKAGASDSNSEGGDIMVPTSEMTVVKEAHIKEGMVPAATSKKPSKVYTKQLSKMKSSSSIPPPLRNKNKRRMQQWMWISMATIMVVLAVIVLGNMGLYSNKLGRNRHPGF